MTSLDDPSTIRPHSYASSAELLATFLTSLSNPNSPPFDPSPLIRPIKSLLCAAILTDTQPFSRFVAARNLAFLALDSPTLSDEEATTTLRSFLPLLDPPFSHPSTYIHLIKWLNRLSDIAKADYRSHHPLTLIK